MNPHDAYHTLKKESLGCDNGSKEAHDYAVNNADEYREVVAKNYEEVSASISMGQSTLARSSPKNIRSTLSNMTVYDISRATLTA